MPNRVSIQKANDRYDFKKPPEGEKGIKKGRWYTKNISLNVDGSKKKKINFNSLVNYINNERAGSNVPLLKKSFLGLGGSSKKKVKNALKQLHSEKASPNKSNESQLSNKKDEKIIDPSSESLSELPKVEIANALELQMRQNFIDSIDIIEPPPSKEAIETDQERVARGYKSKIPKPILSKAELEPILEKLNEGILITPKEASSLYIYLMPYLKLHPEKQPVWETFFKKTLDQTSSSNSSFLISEEQRVDVPTSLLRAQSRTFFDLFADVGDGSLALPLETDILGVKLSSEDKKQFVECLENGLIGKPIPITSENALKLLALSNQFDVMWLEMHCKKWIEENIRKMDPIALYETYSSTIDTQSLITQNHSIAGWLVEICAKPMIKEAMNDEHKMEAYLSLVERGSQDMHPAYLITHLIATAQAADLDQQLWIVKNIKRIENLEKQLIGETAATSQLISKLNEKNVNFVTREFALSLLTHMDPEITSSLYLGVIMYFLRSRRAYAKPIDDAMRIATGRGFLDLKLVDNHFSYTSHEGEERFEITYNGTYPDACFEVNALIDQLKSDYPEGKFLLPYSLDMDTWDEEKKSENKVLEKLLSQNIFSMVKINELTDYESDVLIDALKMPDSSIKYLDIKIEEYDFDLKKQVFLRKVCDLNPPLTDLFYTGRLQFDLDDKLAKSLAQFFMNTQTLKYFSVYHMKFDSKDSFEQVTKSAMENTSLDSFWAAISVVNTNTEEITPVVESMKKRFKGSHLRARR